MNQHKPQPIKDVDPPEVVRTAEALQDLVSCLFEEPCIAVDTESNSLYAYQEQVCLIQISIPGTNYLVDPLELEDLSPLAPVFSAEDIEIVFHAADYDLMMLYADFDFQCNALFDTMWAARILGWPRVGLANILDKYFGVHVNKRYQRYNWGRRPLDAEALRYAWMDSYYLLELRDIQKKELKQKGRWQEAQEVFAYLLENVSPRHGHNPDDYYWRIKGVHHLSHHEQKVLYQLHLWRDHVARRLDRPPVKVVSNKLLVKVARAQPRNKQELYNAGATHRQVRRFGSGMLAALQKPLTSIPHPVNHERPPASVVDLYNTLKAWRKGVARKRGVDPDVILPNAVLWEIAESPPSCMADLLDISGIGPWRKATYGPDIMKMVSA